MSTKALLVYPEMPVTYWSFRYTLPFIGKKASIPPIGLLTVAAMLPKSGRAKHIYADETKPDITRTPAPRFDLLDTKQYAIMALQYSRGCPFSCEFCDIVSMFGHIPRTKTPDQFVEEMHSLYRSGYRGSLFIVDDNFIGNKKNVKELLPVISEWQKKCGFPFTLFTEASVNLAEDNELMDMMVAAGFIMVFIGGDAQNAEY